MTGFGVGEAPIPRGRIVVEVRGVNSKYLDVRVRVPTRLSDLAMFVEQGARERLSRGRFEVGVRTEQAEGASLALDRERARAAYLALLALRDELAPDAEVPFSMLSAVPDLFSPAEGSGLEPMRPALLAALEASIAAMDAMRDREGAALAGDLSARALTVRRLAASIGERAPEVQDAYRRKLGERLDRLLSGAPVDPGRLEQELALYADRADVCEELTRLSSHLDQFDAYVASSEPVGRRLDFLLQEMAREINTVGAKSQDAAIARTVVEAKAELERMREQVQNVE